MTDVQPGIKIDRGYGAAARSALYSDEIVPAGLPITMAFNYFVSSPNAADAAKEAFSAGLWVVDQGIENIGGGWSYGHGRLTFRKMVMRELDLAESIDRERLWDFDEPSLWCLLRLPTEEPAIVKPWLKYEIKVAVAEDQLLAIHMDHPTFDSYKDCVEWPDSFLYRAYAFDPMKQSGVRSHLTIPGKAFRQAILSVPIERRLRSLGHSFCATSGGSWTSSKDKAASAGAMKDKRVQDCTCERCAWFGSTYKGGIVSVGDGVIETGTPETLHRIQLCEHSMQNINLFAGEYLKGGEWTHEILIDKSRAGTDPDGLIAAVDWILGELDAHGNVPPGRHRLGATATCTGGIQLSEEARKTCYGGPK